MSAFGSEPVRDWRCRCSDVTIAGTSSSTTSRERIQSVGDRRFRPVAARRPVFSSADAASSLTQRRLRQRSWPAARSASAAVAEPTKFRGNFRDAIERRMRGATSQFSHRRCDGHRDARGDKSSHRARSL